MVIGKMVLGGGVGGELAMASGIEQELHPPFQLGCGVVGVATAHRK